MMRKRMLKIALLGGTLLVAASAWAIDTYPVKIGGTPVTSENCGNITGKWLLRGKVAYNPATATLTLNGAEIALDKAPDGPGAIIDLNTGEACNIMLKGIVKVTTDSLTCIKSASDLLMAGDGAIIMTTPQGVAVNCDMRLTVFRCHFGIATSKVGLLGKKESGVGGYDLYPSTVCARRSTMIMQCDSLATQELGGFDLVSEEFLYPRGKITFSPSMHSLVEGGKAIAGILMLGPLNLTGDLNEDDTVNVTDVTTLINLILLGGSDDYITTCLADLNEDGMINVTDVTALINEILAAGD